MLKIRIKDILNKIVQVYRNTTLKNKLLLLFYTQILIPMVFIGYTSYTKSAQVLENKSIAYSQDILRMIELRIEDMEADINALTLQLLYDNRIYGFLKESKADALNRYDNSSYIRNLLRDAIFSRESVDSICIITSRNDYIYFDEDREKRSIRDRIPYDEIYAEALKSKGSTTLVLNKTQNVVLDIYAARAIYDRDTFEPIGLIALLIKREFVESLYRDLSEESIRNISVLSEDYKEIVINDSDKIFIDTLKQQGNMGQRGYSIDEKNKMLVSYVFMEDPNWRIVYHIPFSELYKEIDSLKINILLIVVWAIVVLSILSGFTSMDIVNPIKQLVRSMKELEFSGTHLQVNTNRNDEIGYLTRSFNNMSARIHYLLNMIYKEKLTRKEAELKALQAQINPHFLFNTLENINWMAQLNGVPEISNTVTALAKLIEANIGKGNKLITLGQEIEYIDNYIAILKSRFGDRLVIEKNISEDTLSIMIPKLLIQPVVENALHHGLEKVTRQGRVIFNAYKVSEDVIIEIIDNGIGMTENELDNLRKTISGQTPKVENSIGLSNVNKRMRLFYGDEYGVQVESKYDEYTKVTLRLPIKNFRQEGEYYA